MSQCGSLNTYSQRHKNLSIMSRVFLFLFLQPTFCAGSKLTVCVSPGAVGRGSGKCGIWREKLPDAESAFGAKSPQVWATPALVRVHAVLGAFFLFGHGHSVNVSFNPGQDSTGIGVIYTSSQPCSIRKN